MLAYEICVVHGQGQRPDAVEIQASCKECAEPPEEGASQNDHIDATLPVLQRGVRLVPNESVPAIDTAMVMLFRSAKREATERKHLYLLHGAAACRSGVMVEHDLDEHDLGKVGRAAAPAVILEGPAEAFSAAEHICISTSLVYIDRRNLP